MPEANVLYSVTAVVVAGLATWVAVVLKTAKEPWARTLPRPVAEDVPLEAPGSQRPASGPPPSEGPVAPPVKEAPPEPEGEAKP
jgi:hypothetical protein